MKKIGLLALAIVLALGTMGAGFAYWTETLTIEDTNLETGDMIVTFCDGAGWQQAPDGRGMVSNDDEVYDMKIWCNGLGHVLPDPDDNGGDPTVHQTLGQPLDPSERLGNYASTIVGGDLTRTMTVTMTNAYPSYYPTVFFTIRNWGTIPAKVKTIKVIEVSVADNDPNTPATTSVNIPLEVCTPVYLDCDGDGDSDLMLHLSDDADRLFKILEAGSGVIGEHGYFESAVCGDLGIHVEDGAKENVTYDFTVEISVVPFNG